MHGTTLLAAHLEKHRLTQSAFAVLVDVPSSMVSQWLSGARGPGLGYALAIEKATKGAVPASAWVKPRSKKSRVA